MSIEETIKSLVNDWFVSLSGQLCVDMDKKDKFLEAVGMAISALRAQQEAEKNEPLTLDELLEMEGQPVFWKSLIASHCGEWRILNHFGEKMEYLDFSGKSPEMLCNYGKWYVCYRHPPKEAHND